jgi:hypothetical protein
MTAEAVDGSAVAPNGRECPRCGLRVVQRFRWYAIRHCPRCVARYHAVIELLPSHFRRRPPCWFFGV